ncbi:uncharacterized protein Z518_00991 [Rhinocladiella mackenziei CBS 650.93]|uniref:Uncharacterized protein n=1 Tax=Rhinocladiella mackenziei CBS 650.93 TaxID=1442369 RepID=A0A0D2JK86_9EURO|nr:uncharacterized protein Z518_00991 [Rhinocladiella mackenziei CBS 650.93]KIX09910.1 hypothetical protein Z518_00991 [Rhinocladiella mackenziei CBS 650.93]
MAEATEKDQGHYDHLRGKSLASRQRGAEGEESHDESIRDPARRAQLHPEAKWVDQRWVVDEE